MGDPLRALWKIFGVKLKQQEGLPAGLLENIWKFQSIRKKRKGTGGQDCFCLTDGKESDFVLN